MESPTHLVSITDYKNTDHSPHGLRIPDSYDAKIAEICNLWTFWPAIQLTNRLFRI